MDSLEHGCDHGDFTFAFNHSNFSDRVLYIYIESAQSSATPRVETLHISSLILAARSPFFYKLFSNGMRESEQYHATLRINASEEAALMELLKFMYTNNLLVRTTNDVLDVLMLADKFDVTSCMRYCSRLLRNLPMTPESVQVILDLPSNILMAKVFQPVIVAAKQFYAVQHKDIKKFEDEMLSLPLTSIEEIIASDDLQVKSEDEVYNFILKWARAQYPNFEDRCEIIRSRLAKFIRYPYMTYTNLAKVLTCEEFDLVYAQKVVKEAYSFKAEVTQHKHIDENSNINHRFVERAYDHRPLKIVRFEQPHPRLVVYLDLKRDMCERLFPEDLLYSYGFNVDGQGFYIQAQCSMDQKSSSRIFSLFLVMPEEEEGVSFVFDYEVAIRLKSTEEFVSKSKGKHVLTADKKAWYQKLFGIPWTCGKFESKSKRIHVFTINGKKIVYQYLIGMHWTSFIAEDSVYFVDDVVYFRVELTRPALRN